MKLEELTQDKLDELLETLQANERSVNGLKADLAKAKQKAKGADIDPDAYAEALTQVETLKADLDKATKTSNKTIEQLTKQVAEKDGAVAKYLIDGQLSDNLAKAGVKPEFMDAVKAMHRSQATIVQDNGEYVAKIGDKPMTEAITAWVGSDAGKHFVSAPANSGGGSSGGSGNGQAKTMKRADYEALPQFERGKVIKDGVTITDD